MGHSSYLKQSVVKPSVFGQNYPSFLPTSVSQSFQTAAHYLLIPRATVRSWVADGRPNQDWQAVL